MLSIATKCPVFSHSTMQSLDFWVGTQIMSSKWIGQSTNKKIMHCVKK